MNLNFGYLWFPRVPSNSGGWWSRAYGSDVGLAIDFVNNRTYNAGVQSTPYALLTYTAPSNKTVTGSNGLLRVTNAAAELPIDYDPITLACKGVLIEEARTQLLTYSQDFTNIAWSLLRLTISANAIAAPDGTTTADQLLDTAVAGTHAAIQTIAKAASAIQYAASVYLKANVRDQGELRVSDQAGNGVRITFNLTTASIAGPVTFGAGFTGGSASITSVGNGWYRVVLVATSNSAVTLGHEVYVSDAVGATSYTGDGSGFYAWGAMLEAGAFPTSYVPSVASQVTRAADNISLLTSAFGYNAAESTLFVNYIAPLGVAQDIVWIANGLAESLGFYINAVPAVLLWCRAGGATQAAGTLGTLLGPSNKVAGAFKINDFSGSSNGAGVATDTVGTMPTPTSLQFSPRSIVNVNASIYIKSLAYWPTRKANGFLQQVTT